MPDLPPVKDRSTKVAKRRNRMPVNGKSVFVIQSAQVKRAHPTYSIEACPNCEYPEADGGFCPNCGWTRHTPNCPCGRK